jgi:two-component system, NtrC family, nitrogen regulation response regulator NtrX
MVSTKKILVVEDDRNLLEMIDDILRGEGYSPILAENCEQARIILDAENPALVILDLFLPDGDGFDLCRRVVGKIGRNTRVFVISGITNIDCKLKSFVCGARRFFGKPFDVDELVAAVREAVDSRAVFPVAGL